MHADLQTNGAVRPIIRKKAALCLLRLLRKAGPDSDMLAPDTWSVKLVRLSSNLISGFVIWDAQQLLQPCRHNHEAFRLRL